MLLDQLVLLGSTFSVGPNLINKYEVEENAVALIQDYKPPPLPLYVFDTLEAAAGCKTCARILVRDLASSLLQRS